jgi:hypothetical protein
MPPWTRQEATAFNQPLSLDTSSVTTLEGQAGSYVFGGGDGLCTQTNIAHRGSTNSFKLCTTNANRVCNVYSFGHLDAPYPTEQFDLVAGVNTLSFRRRESCALASQLTFTA